MPWVCPACDHETELGVNICSNCREPRPGSYGGEVATAKAISKRRRVDGVALESILDFAAWTLFFLGVALSIWIVMSGGPIPALVVISGTLLNWLLLRSLGEIIRLLKRNVGLNYGGHVSGSRVEDVVLCSNCGSLLHSKTSCDGCGARIRTPDEDSPGVA